jgi:PAS domain S-box-containing protein
MYGCIGLGALTFLGFKLGFNTAAVGFCYLVLIESLALGGSLIVCVALCIIATGCLSYFFTPPLFSFRVDAVQDLVALVAFLATSIVISALTTRVREDAETREVAQEEMINTVPAMIWSALPNGSRDFNSQQALQYTGLSAAEAAGTGWARTLHPEDRDRVLEAWRRSVETGEPLDSEARARSAAGEYRWFRIRGAPLRDAQGNVVKWYGLSIDIDERMRALDALRRSEEQWKAVFEHNPTMYLMADSGGIIRMVNDFGASQLGYTPEELVGGPVLGMFHEADREPVQKNFNDCVKDAGRTDSWEARKVRKDGSILWVRENARAVERADNDVVVLIACEDITKRKQAEEALRASEARWREVFETAAVGITTTDMELRYLTANPSFLRMLGYTEDELRDLTVYDITYEEDREITRELIDELVAHKRHSYRVEKRFRRKDSGIIWAEVSTSIVPATEHTPAFLPAVIVDITDRKHAEQAMRRNEAYLTDVFETLPDGLAIVGRDYRYLRVNATYELRTGLRPEQVVGMHVAEVNSMEAFNEIIKGELDRCLAGEHVSYGEWFTYPGLGRRYLAVTYSPIFISDQGSPSAALVVTRDLTEYMQASEALLQAQAELAHVNRVSTLGMLAASIAHEVNQPLAALVTNANAGLRWLGAEPPNLPETRETMARIVGCANRAADVIARIRALARRAPLQQEPLDINELIREVIALTRAEMDRNRVALALQLTDELPRVQGDRIQLQQVVLNLVMNAIEAMKDTEPRELRVISRKDEGGNVLVSVGDSGPGLDPGTEDSVFAAFYTTKSEGTGLGLAISRSIIESHGGRIWASGNTPRGEVFQFIVPRGGDTQLPARAE